MPVLYGVTAKTKNRLKVKGIPLEECSSKEKMIASVFESWLLVKNIIVAYLPIADAEEPEHDSIFSEIWKALAPI